jgi:hypothetical protein
MLTGDGCRAWSEELVLKTPTENLFTKISTRVPSEVNYQFRNRTLPRIVIACRSVVASAALEEWKQFQGSHGIAQDLVNLLTNVDGQ